MLFKSNNEYDPDAGCDDAPEAVADAAPAPQSEARLGLAKLLSERAEAQGEMEAARAAIGRLQGYVAAPGPIERDIAALDSAEAELIAQWSTSGGTFPTLDAERRHELEEALADARNKAAGAQRAIPALEAKFTRASNRAGAISHAISAAISDIIIAEVEPCFAEIVNLKSDLAMRIARAEAGREIALRTVESIPNDRRLAIASEFYSALGAVEKVRILAMSNPPMAHDHGGWAEFSRDLASDATARLEG